MDGREQWPLEMYGMDTILDEGVEAKEFDLRDLLGQVIKQLKINNMHLSLITDTMIEKTEVE